VGLVKSEDLEFKELIESLRDQHNNWYHSWGQARAVPYPTIRLQYNAIFSPIFRNKFCDVTIYKTVVPESDFALLISVIARQV
jgi:hypothetical protein